MILLEILHGLIDFLKKESIAFFVAFVVCVIGNAIRVSSMLGFPEQEAYMVDFIVFTVAIAVWHITDLGLKQKLRSKTLPDANQCHSITEPLHQDLVAYAKSQLRSFTILFLCFFTFKSVFVVSRHIGVPPPEIPITEYNEAPVVFFKPLYPVASFKEKVLARSKMSEYNAGFRFLADNDFYWLDDELGQFWFVACTKVLLLIFGVGFLLCLIRFSVVIFHLRRSY